jgi:hypothetical protein
MFLERSRLGLMVNSGQRHHAAARLAHAQLKTSKFFRFVDLGAAWALGDA